MVFRSAVRRSCAPSEGPKQADLVRLHWAAAAAGFLGGGRGQGVRHNPRKSQGLSAGGPCAAAGVELGAAGRPVHVRPVRRPRVLLQLLLRPRHPRRMGRRAGFARCVVCWVPRARADPSLSVPPGDQWVLGFRYHPPVADSCGAGAGCSYGEAFGAGQASDCVLGLP